MVDETVLLQQLITGLLLGSIYALVAMGFSLIFGTMNIVNFAHGNIMMVMMFAAYWLFTSAHIDPLLATPVIFVLSFGLGWLIYRYVIRSISHAEHSSTLLATLGVAIVLENVILAAFGGDIRTVETSYTTATIPLAEARISVARSFAAAASLLLLVTAFHFLQRTDLGRAIRAVADDLIGAEAVGVPIHRVYGIAFGLGAAAAGVAGAMIISFTPVSPFIGVDYLTKSFVIVVLGGVGSLPGALAGALVLGLLEALSSLWLPGSLVNGLIFGLLVLMLLFKPSGLFAKG